MRLRAARRVPRPGRIHALAMKQQRVGLVNGGHADARNVHMRRPARRPHNGVGHVFRRQRRQSLVHFGGALLVAVKAHQAEIRLHHPRIDAGHAHRRSQQVLAQPVVDGRSAALLAQYTAPLGYVISPAVEPRLTTCPRLRTTIPGTTARVT
jgi:hypothetical protein